MPQNFIQYPLANMFTYLMQILGNYKFAVHLVVQFYNYGLDGGNKSLKAASVLEMEFNISYFVINCKV